MTVRHIFDISEDDHPRTVSHARDHWWTLDFANAFVPPGVNSRGELVPSHGASRRRLGDYALVYPYLIYCNLIWGSTYKTRFNKIMNIQKTILRLMTFISCTWNTLRLY
jgi:hypothetical protein